MAVDAFLLVDGVEGESVDAQYKGWIEIESWSWGVSDPVTIDSATGGAGSGKAVPGDFVVVKKFDKASPVFFKNCCSGAHYSTVTLAMRKSGGGSTGAREFLVFRFQTVFTTKIDWSGPGDEGPEEQITFVFGELQVHYVPQLPSGEDGVPVDSGWDFVRNAAA